MDTGEPDAAAMSPLGMLAPLDEQWPNRREQLALQGRRAEQQMGGAKCTVTGGTCSKRAPRLSHGRFVLPTTLPDCAQPPGVVHRNLTFLNCAPWLHWAGAFGRWAQWAWQGPCAVPPGRSVMPLARLGRPKLPWWGLGATNFRSWACLPHCAAPTAPAPPAQQHGPHRICASKPSPWRDPARP